MSEDNKGTPPASGAPAGTISTTEALKQMKSEFDRKLSNMEASTRKLLDQIAATVKPAAPAAPAQKSVEDEWFDNPRAAAERIKSEVRQELRQEQEVNTKTNSTIAKLTQEFPELMDEGHDLTKKALEIFDGFSAEEKRSAVAYRAAVREAAMDLGVLPKSKRTSSEPESEDNFSLSGFGNARPRASSKRDSLDARTAEVARYMGLDVDKPEVKERLKKQQNKIFGK